MRKIHDPKRVMEGVYQRPMKSEVRERLQRENIVEAIKTDAAMVRPQKKDGRRKSSEESDRVEIRLWKSKRKTEKPMGGTSIRGHKKPKNPQLEGEDPRSEVMEENHKRSKNE